MSVRKKNKGLIYLRRSSDKQATSLESQLTWAVGEAQRTGVSVDAARADLEHMQRKGISSYKSIRLDDGITGSNLNRQGLQKLISDVTNSVEISHIFAYRRDRISRPEEPLETLQIEKQLGHCGITLVFSDKVIEPIARGERNLARDLDGLMDYYNSGAFLDQLAERMILTHQTLAKKGYSTGGNAPYGHVRALYGPDDCFAEYLPRKRNIREDGYHVRWVPGPKPEDRKKIKVWLYILELYKSGWGGKRIANHLNALGIPSPGAGTKRTDHGVEHYVSGKWGHNAVLSLIRNSIIIAKKEYGRRSEGKIRRLDTEGWRMLEDADRNGQGQPKLVNNEEDCIVRAPSGVEPLYCEEEWEKIQKINLERSKSQRGIPRAKDPAKYVLSSRVFDMSDGCGHPMYGTVQSGRPVLRCGRYMKTSGDECNNNSIDSEGLTKFVLTTLVAQVDQLGLREKVEERLYEIAKQEIAGERENNSQEFTEDIDAKLEILRSDKQTVVANMAREDDEEIYNELKCELRDIKNQIQQLELQKTELAKRKNSNKASNMDQEVQAALSILEDISQALVPEKSRLEIKSMINRLGLRVGLTFAEAIKGKKRKVRKLISGVIVFGDEELPVRLHGKDRVDGGDSRASQKSNCCQSGSIEKDSVGKGGCESAGRDDRSSPSANAQPDLCHREGISFTKVSRADWIRTSDLYTPSVARYQPAPRPDLIWI